MKTFDHFDGVLYINLEKRKDRNKKIQQELLRLDLDPAKITRIEGYYDELNGVRGCVYSHIKALDFALSQKWKRVLILEDDCLFVKNPERIHSYIANFFHHFKNEWDVFFLGTHLCSHKTTSHSDYLQVEFSLRSHAYAVNGPYLPKLKDHFLSTYKSLEQDLFFIDALTKALDRRWVELQYCDRWYVGKKMIARQSRSYSDIEKGVKPRR